MSAPTGPRPKSLTSILQKAFRRVSPDDPRVKAALNWISKFYTVEENPGQGTKGLYYYYHTFAKTLAVLGKPTLTDAKGQEHDWRADLIERLTELQKDNGSWVNSSDRFYEGDPNLVTAYSLMCLSHCKPSEIPRYAACGALVRLLTSIEKVTAGRHW
jgi:squalene-hopene/tetraprenyl-beta-curcumene cyclase